MKFPSLSEIVSKGHDKLWRLKPASSEQVQAIIDQAFSYLKIDLPEDHDRFVEFKAEKGLLQLSYGFDRKEGDLDVYRAVFSEVYHSLVENGFVIDSSVAGTNSVSMYKEENDRPSVLYDVKRYVNKDKKLTLMIDLFDAS